MFRVNIPWGCSKQVYTSLREKERFSYASVRKATYRGCSEKLNISIINLSSHHSKIIVFKFCVIGGIFLFWFFDALFFTMFIKEEYGEGVDSIGDLIDRDMSLGINIHCTLYI